MFFTCIAIESSIYSQRYAATFNDNELDINRRHIRMVSMLWHHTRSITRGRPEVVK